MLSQESVSPTKITFLDVIRSFAGIIKDEKPPSSIVRRFVFITGWSILVKLDIPEAF